MLARDKMFAAVLACLPVLAAWLFLPPLSDAFRVKNHVVSLGSCLLLLLWFTRRPITTFRFPAVIRIALACCLASVIVSTPAASHPIVAWHVALEYLPLGFLLYSVANQEDSDWTARALEFGWLAAAVGVAMVALQQTLVPSWLDLGFVAPGKMAAFSTLGNPIWTSIVLMVALPLAVHSAQTGPRILWALPPILAAALWTTQSRQALLALATMCWVAVVWRGSRRQTQLAIAGLGLLLCVVPFLDFSASVFHSLKGRLLIIGGAWQILIDHPLTGIGLGHLGAAFPPYQAELLTRPGWQSYAEHAAVIEDAHNEFLHWGATTGALGFGGFTLLCSAIAWLGWRSPQIRAKRWHWYLGYVGMLITLLFTGIQPQLSLTLLLVSCQAVLVAGTASDGQRFALQRAASLFGAVTTLVVAALAGQWAVQDIRASYLEGEGDRLMQERDAWLAGQVYAEALAIDSDRGSLLKKHASILYLEGRYSGALAELSNAKGFTGDTGVTLLEAEILANAGRDLEAIAAYQCITASFPQLLSPHFILGQLYYRQQRYDLARAELQRVIKIQPSTHNPQLTAEKVLQQKEMARVFLNILERQHGVP